jgi:hypothetical protein
MLASQPTAQQREITYAGTHLSDLGRDQRRPDQEGPASGRAERAPTRHRGSRLLRRAVAPAHTLGSVLPAGDPSPIPTAVSIFGGERLPFPKPPRELAELDVFPCRRNPGPRWVARGSPTKLVYRYLRALALRVAVAGTHRADTHAPAEVPSLTLPVTTLGVNLFVLRTMPFASNDLVYGWRC